MQKTNFRFEAIVHDDASTDGSAAIIREYAERYPDIIKPIYEQENLYRKRDGSLDRVMYEAATGRYIALCEGDDFWTNPHKLQKQVEFMESHPDCSMCFHAVWMFTEGSDEPAYVRDIIEDRVYDPVDIMLTCPAQTASVLMRREVFDSELYRTAKKKILGPSGDLRLFLVAGELGTQWGISDVMSVYRRHPGGISYNWENNFPIYLRYARFFYAIPGVMGKRYKAGALSFGSQICLRGIRGSIRKGDYRSALRFWHLYVHHDTCHFFKCLFYFVRKRLFGR